MVKIRLRLQNVKALDQWTVIWSALAALSVIARSTFNFGQATVDSAGEVRLGERRASRLKLRQRPPNQLYTWPIRAQGGAPTHSLPVGTPLESRDRVLTRSRALLLAYSSLTPRSLLLTPRLLLLNASFEPRNKKRAT